MKQSPAPSRAARLADRAFRPKPQRTLWLAAVQAMLVLAIAWLGLSPALAQSFVSPSSAAKFFYVDPVSGSDSNDGSQPTLTSSNHGPFKTIGAAQTAVRGVKSSVSGNITVYLRGGYYTRPSGGALTSPIASFTAQDSGSSSQIISWAAYNGETPVISGGVQLTGWANSFSVSNQEVYAVVANEHFRQLYLQQWDSTNRILQIGSANTLKLTRARTPTAGSAYPTLAMPVLTSYTPGSSSLFAVVSSSNSAWISQSPTTSQTNQTEVVMPKTFGVSRLQVNSTGSILGSPAIDFMTNTTGVSQSDLEFCASFTVLSTAEDTLCKFPANTAPGPFYYNTGCNNSVVNGMQTVSNCTTSGQPPNSAVTTQNNPYYYENNIDFIENPNDWYEDFSTGDTFVLPPSGVTLPTSSGGSLVVIAPAGMNAGTLSATATMSSPAATPPIVNAGDNETLVSIGIPPSGTTNCSSGSSTVSYVQFFGLTFAHSNWLWPSTNGYVGFNGITYYTGFADSSTQGDLATTSYPLPAAVQLGCTSNVAFIENLFTQLGADGISDFVPGLQFSQPGNSQNLLLYGNAFTEIAGTAVNLNSGFGALTVEANLLTRVGNDYGGTGIAIESANSAMVANNDVRYMSNQGIMIGGTPAAPTNNPIILVTENMVSNSPLDYNDEGAIYNNQSNRNFSNMYTCFSGLSPSSGPCVGSKMTGPTKVAISWNQVNNVFVPVWFPTSGLPVGFLYPSPVSIYLDFQSEGVEVDDNDITPTTNLPSPPPRLFHFNCEADNLTTENIVALTQTYTGFPCSNQPGGPSTVSTATNNTSVTLNFPSAPGLPSTINTLWSKLLGRTDSMITPTPPAP
jgi:hypothetical protein